MDNEKELLTGTDIDTVESVTETAGEVTEAAENHPRLKLCLMNL